MVAASSAGHSGAASAPWEHVHRHFAVAALLSPETPLRRSYVPFRANHRLACRFRLDGRMQASRLHAPVKSEPVCGDHSPRRRYIRAFQSQARLRELPHWWILGRCGPPILDIFDAFGPYTRTTSLVCFLGQTRMRISYVPRSQIYTHKIDNNRIGRCTCALCSLSLSL